MQKWRRRQLENSKFMAKKWVGAYYFSLCNPKMNWKLNVTLPCPWLQPSWRHDSMGIEGGWMFLCGGSIGCLVVCTRVSDLGVRPESGHWHVKKTIKVVPTPWSSVPLVDRLSSLIIHSFLLRGGWWWVQFCSLWEMTINGTFGPVLQQMVNGK